MLFQGCEFGSQHPSLGDSQPQAVPAPGELMPSSCIHRYCTYVHTDLNRMKSKSNILQKRGIATHHHLRKCFLNASTGKPVFGPLLIFPDSNQGSMQTINVDWNAYLCKCPSLLYSCQFPTSYFFLFKGKVLLVIESHALYALGKCSTLSCIPSQSSTKINLILDYGMVACF